MSHLQVGLIDDIDPGFTVDPVTGNILPSIAVSSARVSRKIVAETDAIGISHVGQLAEGLSTGRFAILDLPWRKTLPTAEMGIAYKRERTLPPSARTFIGLIRKQMRAQARPSK